MKTCSKCRETKSRTEFNRDRSRRDGLRGWCKACEAAAQVAYWAEHPDRLLTQYARRRGAIIVEIVDPRVLFERDAGICHICSRSVDPDRWEADHVAPLSAGGVHSYANTAVSHPSCNRSKGDRTPTTRKAT
jgi:5-methylcytosine-specific restriction endonuclease McrA